MSRELRNIGASVRPRLLADYQILLIRWQPVPSRKMACCASSVIRDIQSLPALPPHLQSCWRRCANCHVMHIGPTIFRYSIHST